MSSTDSPALHSAAAAAAPAPRGARQTLGAWLLAWLASWNSLACDPEVDIHLYPFF